MKRPLTAVLERVGDYFMKRSPIHDAVRRIAQTLAEMGISFAVADALAANAQGHVRTTEDVALLMRPEDLPTFKERWLGEGWVEKYLARGAFATQYTTLTSM